MKKKIKKEIELLIESADKFKDPESGGSYVFPFDVFDKTPGGSNLGRIQWIIELHPSKKIGGRIRIGELWVHARQTKDQKYRRGDKIIYFKIPTFAESLTTRSSLDKQNCYAPWRMFFCEMHKGAFILDSYPSNHHSKLIINADSSISIDVNYE